ncbi:hypothetical protein A1F97_10958, partial [Pyrenophora tritici-repentis]
MPARHPANTSREIHVKIILKPNSTYNIHSITSIAYTGNTATLKSALGLEAHLKPGCIILPNPSYADAMVLKRSETATDGFVAEVIIPLAHRYHVVKVNDVREKGDAPGWTIVETTDALFEVGGGDYVVRRKNFGRSVIIENL